MMSIPTPPRSAPSRASRTTPRGRRNKTNNTKYNKNKNKETEEATLNQQQITLGSVVLPADPNNAPKLQRKVLCRGALQAGAPFYSPYVSARMGAASRRLPQGKLPQNKQRRVEQCSSSLGWPEALHSSGMNNHVGQRAGTAPTGAKHPRPTVSRPLSNSRKINLDATSYTSIITTPSSSQDATLVKNKNDYNDQNDIDNSSDVSALAETSTLSVSMPTNRND